MSLEIIQLRDGQPEIRFHIDSDGDVAMDYGDDETRFIPWGDWLEITQWLEHRRFEFKLPKEVS